MSPTLLLSAVALLLLLFLLLLGRYGLAVSALALSRYLENGVLRFINAAPVREALGW